MNLHRLSVPFWSSLFVVSLITVNAGGCRRTDAWKTPPSTSSGSLGSPTIATALSGSALVPQTVILGNVVKAIRTLRSADPEFDGGLEIELASKVPFLPRNDSIVLDVGKVNVTLGGCPEEDCDLYRIIFRLTSAQRASIRSGDPLSVRYSLGDAPEHWYFGRLDLGMIGR